MASSKQLIDSSLDPDDISKTRPFSLEERNLNINDISFSRILRSDHTLSSLNTTRIFGSHPNPPSFYEDDIKKWKDKFENAIKNRLKLKKVINDQTIESDSQRYVNINYFIEEKSNLEEVHSVQSLLTLMRKGTQAISTIYYVKESGVTAIVLNLNLRSD